MMMKPYIVDDIDIVVAKMSLVLFLIVMFALTYDILLDYKSTGTIVYYEIAIATLSIVNTYQSIRRLINHIKHKTVYLRVDQDGILMKFGDQSETIPWDEVKEIYFRMRDKILYLCVYLSNNEEVYYFNLVPYIDGISLYSLRRALRHFSGRKDIVKNKSLLINKD